MSLPEVSLDGSTSVKSVTSPAAKSPDGQAPKSRPSTAVEVSDLNEAEATDLKTVRPTALDRVLLVLRYWASQVTDAAEQTGSRRGGFGDAQSESWRQYRAYVRSRAWLPDGYDGWFLKWVSVGYYNTLGNASFAIDGFAWVFKRVLRFSLAFIVAATAVALWFIFS
jgi:hypothetical protein